MSRIGKKPVMVPSGVEASLAGNTLTIKGPKGTLKQTFHPHVTCKLEDIEGARAITFTVQNEINKLDRSLWGLSRSLAQNMVIGVTKGYEEKLEVVGIGFKVAVAGQKLTMEVGFSHEVKYEIPAGITIVADKNILTITGADKQLVGETAASIRRFKKPEPYKGTGIKYSDEQIRRKAGKAATKAAA